MENSKVLASWLFLGDDESGGCQVFADGDSFTVWNKETGECCTVDMVDFIRAVIRLVVVEGERVKSNE